MFGKQIMDFKKYMAERYFMTAQPLNAACLVDVSLPLMVGKLQPVTLIKGISPNLLHLSQEISHLLHYFDALTPKLARVSTSWNVCNFHWAAVEILHYGFTCFAFVQLMGKCITNKTYECIIEVFCSEFSCMVVSSYKVSFVLIKVEDTKAMAMLISNKIKLLGLDRYYDSISWGKKIIVSAQIDFVLV